MMFRKVNVERITENRAPTPGGKTSQLNSGEIESWNQVPLEAEFSQLSRSGAEYGVYVGLNPNS